MRPWTALVGHRLASLALAAGVGLVALAAASARADDLATPRPCAKGCPLNHAHRSGPGVGTLGYGPPGLHPGFQGFGLGYHKGYGYGGKALGPGAEGGYPFYGGPGYPHPAPRLRRIGGANPFPFYGGPGGPTPECPQYFGGVGPLVEDRPVVRIVGGPPGMQYGEFNGMMPYPDSTFAPFTSAASGESLNVSQPAGPPTPPASSADDPR